MKTLLVPFSQIRDHCLCPGDQGLLGLDAFYIVIVGPLDVLQLGWKGILQWGNKDYHRVTPHSKPYTGEGKNPKKVAASAQMRSSRKLRSRRDLYSFPSGRAELSKMELCRVGVGGISSPELEVNSGIGEILSPKFGLFNSARQLECSLRETWWLKVLRNETWPLTLHLHHQ